MAAKREVSSKFERSAEGIGHWSTATLKWDNLGLKFSKRSTVLHAIYYVLRKSNMAMESRV
jgi:hypothetical protein